MAVRNQLEFSSYVSEQLRYYVYVLKDPANGRPFYVGKGRDNRVFSHAAAASTDLPDVPNPKLDKIREIRHRGDEVDVVLARHGLDNDTAHEIEAALIQQLGLTDLLLNLVAGHGVERGMISPQDAIAMYDARRAPAFPKALNGLLLRIPVLWHPAMPAADLYEATHGWWVLGPRRERVRYAFAVNRGVIREVYQVESWRKRTSTDRGAAADVHGRQRWGFEGRPAAGMDKYRNTNVRHLLKPGAANPVRYINC